MMGRTLVWYTKGYCAAYVWNLPSLLCMLRSCMAISAHGPQQAKLQVKNRSSKHKQYKSLRVTDMGYRVATHQNPAHLWPPVKLDHRRRPAMTCCGLSSEPRADNNTMDVCGCMDVHQIEQLPAQCGTFVGLVARPQIEPRRRMFPSFFAR